MEERREAMMKKLANRHEKRILQKRNEPLTKLDIRETEKAFITATVSEIDMKTPIKQKAVIDFDSPIIPFDERADKQIKALSAWSNTIMEMEDSEEMELGSSKMEACRKIQKMLSNRKEDVDPKNENVDQKTQRYRSIFENNNPDELRKRCRDILTDSDISNGINTLIIKNTIAVRNDVSIYSDITLQTSLLRVFISFHPAWLKAALEAVFNTTIHTSPGSLNRTLSTFLINNVFTSRKLLKNKKFAQGSGKPIVTAAGKSALHAHFLLYTMLLLYVMEKSYLERVIPNLSKLFTSSSPFKCLDDVFKELSKEVLSGSSLPMKKAFARVGYTSIFKQSFIEDYNYRAADFEDFSNGLILAKLIETVGQLPPKSILSMMRDPSGDRIRKVRNVQIVLDEIRKMGVETDVTAEKIVRKDKESILSLLWTIIGCGVMSEKHVSHQRENKSVAFKSENQNEMALKVLETCRKYGKALNIEVPNLESLANGELLAKAWNWYIPSSLSVYFYDGETVWDKLVSLAESEMKITRGIDQDICLFVKMFFERLECIRMNNEAATVEGIPSNATFTVSRDSVVSLNESCSNATFKIPRTPVRSTIHSDTFLPRNSVATEVIEEEEDIETSQSIMEPERVESEDLVTVIARDSSSNVCNSLNMSLEKIGDTSQMQLTSTPSRSHYNSTFRDMETTITQSIFNMKTRPVFRRSISEDGEGIEVQKDDEKEARDVVNSIAMENLFIGSDTDLRILNENSTVGAIVREEKFDDHEETDINQILNGIDENSHENVACINRNESWRYPQIENNVDGYAQSGESPVTEILDQNEVVLKSSVACGESEEILNQKEAKAEYPVYPPESDEILDQNETNAESPVHPPESDEILDQNEAKAESPVHPPESDEILDQNEAKAESPVHPPESDEILYQNEAKAESPVHPPESDEILDQNEAKAESPVHPPESDEILDQNEAKAESPVHPPESDEILDQNEAKAESPVHPPESDKILDQNEAKAESPVYPPESDEILDQNEAKAESPVYPPESGEFLDQNEAKVEFPVHPPESGEILIREKIEKESSRSFLRKQKEEEIKRATEKLIEEKNQRFLNFINTCKQNQDEFEEKLMADRRNLERIACQPRSENLDNLDVSDLREILRAKRKIAEKQQKIAKELDRILVQRSSKSSQNDAFIESSSENVEEIKYAEEQFEQAALIIQRVFRGWSCRRKCADQIDAIKNRIRDLKVIVSNENYEFESGVCRTHNDTEEHKSNGSAEDKLRRYTLYGLRSDNMVIKTIAASCIDRLTDLVPGFTEKFVVKYNGVRAILMILQEAHRGTSYSKIMHLLLNILERIFKKTSKLKSGPSIEPLLRVLTPKLFTLLLANYSNQQMFCKICASIDTIVTWWPDRKESYLAKEEFYFSKLHEKLKCPKSERELRKLEQKCFKIV